MSYSKQQYQDSIHAKVSYTTLKVVKSLVMILCMSAVIHTYAQDNENTYTNPYAKTWLVDLPKNTHSIYTGAGLSNEFMHIIAEKPTKYGHFYGKIGQFYSGQGVATQVGYRYPYKLTCKHNNGVYVGAFAGHVQNDRKNGKRFNRLGAGLDIGYVWFDSSRIGLMNIGVYMPAPTKHDNGSALKMRPTLQASISLSTGLF